MSDRYSDMVAYAIVFQQQIMHTMEDSHGSRWSWSNYIPGPISQKDAEFIMGLAGCWCEDPSQESVRFYTNQNHERWQSPCYC